MRKTSLATYVNLSIFWFALSVHWNTLSPVVLPAVLLRYVPPESKGTYLGITLGVGALMALLVQPLVGVVSDHTGHRWGRRRPYIVAGVLVDLLFLAILAGAPTYAVFFLAVVGLQIGGNMAQGPYQALIPDRVPHDKRGIASGFMGLMGVLGQIAAGLIMMRFAGRVSAVILIIALTMTLLMLWTVLAVRERPLSHRPEHRLGYDLARFYWIDVRRYPDFAWLVVSRFLVLLAMQSIINFAQYFLRDVIRVPDPETTTAQMVSIVAVAAVVAIIPGGWLSDRIGRKRIIYIAGVMMMLGIYFMISTRSMLMLTICLLFVGMATGLFFSVDWALATDLVPKDESGKYMGFSNFPMAGAGMVAAFIGGPLIDHFNAVEPGLGYTVLFATAVGYVALGLCALVPVREGSGRSPALEEEGACSSAATGS